MFIRTALALALVAAASLAHADAKVLKKVAPEYPGEAVKKNIVSGSVRAKIAIAGDGKVSNVEVVEAEPKRIFDGCCPDARSQARLQVGRLSRDRGQALRLVRRPTKDSRHACRLA